jgi:hypothetical protein
MKSNCTCASTRSAASSLAYRNGVAACSSGRILLEPAHA